MGKLIDEYNAAKEYHACVETIMDRLWTESVKYHKLQDEYENRLKVEKVAMLTEILTDFDNLIEPNSTRIDCESIIEQKIQALEGKIKTDNFGNIKLNRREIAEIIAERYHVNFMDVLVVSESTIENYDSKYARKTYEPVAFVYLTEQRGEQGE